MKIIIIAIGIIIFLLHLLPLVKAKINFGNIFGMFTGFMLIFLGVFLDKIIFLFSTKYKVIFIVISMLILTFYLLFFITLAKIIFNAKSSAKNEKTVIVLGCRVKGLVPTKALMSRCLKAYEYLSENKNSICILSGGQGQDELISEAECMKNILIEKGIDEKRIYIENKSTSTQENLKFSKEIIESNNLDKNIIICTSEYHIYRSVIMAKEFDLKASSLAAHSMKFFRIPAFTREVFAVWYYVLKKRKPR